MKAILEGFGLAVACAVMVMVALGPLAFFCFLVYAAFHFILKAW